MVSLTLPPGRILTGYSVITTDDGVAQPASIDYGPQGAVPGRRYVIVETGYAPAFSTAEYPPEGGGDWRALYRLAYGPTVTGPILIPLFRGRELCELLDPYWSSAPVVRILPGDGAGALWGVTSSIPPAIWVSLLELPGDYAGCWGR